MIKKKKGVFFVFLFLSIFLTVAISADTCTIQSSCNPANTVMKLSSATNAHAEQYNGVNYNSYLCCNFTGIHTVNGNNKVIGISSSTNAHAEIPSLSNYATNVYFGDLECSSNSGSCLSGYDVPMLSLSSNTNAHVAQFDYYPIKICCKRPGSICTDTCASLNFECGTHTVCGVSTNCPNTCVSGETCNSSGTCVSTNLGGAYWASANNPGQEISYIKVVPGVTQVALVVKGVTPVNSTTGFEIYEDDILSPDDKIRTGANALTGNVDGAGTGVSYWTITDEDLGKTSDYNQFYFKSNSLTSNDLSMGIIGGGACVGINFCNSYTDRAMCEADTCAKAPASVALMNASITCGDGYICKCSWNDVTGNCSAGWTIVNKSLGWNVNPSLGVGTCSYSESTNDNCSDGFLTYSWIANINWPSDNSGWATKQECINAGGDAASCVKFPDLLYHYDPLFNGVNSLLTQCIGGSNTLECPAQIQLAFFTLKNFIIAIIILGLIYVGYAIKKENKGKRKKKNKRKKAHK